MLETTDRPIRIYILDPFTLIRAGLRLIIEAEPGMQVVGDAGDTITALEMVSSLTPDIILLKLHPSGDPDLEVIPRLLEACDQSRIILMTTTDDFQICSQAIQRGVLGVVVKTKPPQTLLMAIRKVHSGEVWLERSLMADLVNDISLAHRSPDKGTETEHISLLSDRERQVVELISLGLKNKQIAERLSISEVTVRHHLTSIYNKLGVSDRLELLVFAHRNGLTRAPKNGLC
jgi:two-component system nitrate/nitrite response regulator NarL